MKALNRKIKSVIYIAIVVGFWGADAPVLASCYEWTPGDVSIINKENDYYETWKDKKHLQLVAKLRHGTKIKVIKFIEGACGGDVYLEAKVKGRTIRGWTNSDILFYSTR